MNNFPNENHDKMLFLMCMMTRETLHYWDM